jgi:hypothetical protein
MIGRCREIWRLHQRIRKLEAERAVSPRPRRLAIDEELIPLMVQEIALMPSLTAPVPRQWKRQNEP